MEENIFSCLRELMEQNISTVLGTIVAADAPLEEYVGGKALFKGQELVSWHHLNHDLRQSFSFSNLSDSLDQARIVRHYLPRHAHPSPWVDVYLEAILPAQELIIFGGGHISQPLAQLGKMVGFHVTVVDDRPDFANHSRFPQADRVICLPFPQALQEIPIGVGTFVTIVTRGHQYDQICLRGVIEKSPAYLGMIGSKSRVKKVMHELLAEGISQEAVEAVHAPIGLDIHADTPEEIAVSIIAQIISLRRGPGTINKKILHAITEPGFQNIKKALITLVRRKGSAPRGVGAKMLVLEDGRCFGTIGGGCVEAGVRSRALLAMHEEKPVLYHYDLTNDIAGEEGMACGGTIDAFIEPL